MLDFESHFCFCLPFEKSFSYYLPPILQALGASWGSLLMMCPWKQGTGSHVSYHSRQEKPCAWFFLDFKMMSKYIKIKEQSTFLVFLISRFDKAFDIILPTPALESLSVYFCITHRRHLQSVMKKIPLIKK